MKLILVFLITVVALESCVGQNDPKQKDDGKGSDVPPKNVSTTSDKDSTATKKDTIVYEQAITADSLDKLLKTNEDAVAVRVIFNKKTYSVFIIKPNIYKVCVFPKPDKGPHSFAAIKKVVYGKKEGELLLAMNGGMYEKNGKPVGLLVLNGKVWNKLNTKTDSLNKGNFYLQPNGVFAIDSGGKGYVVPTSEYSKLKAVNFATQSGPMMVINGKVNALFKQGSTNFNIRNAVGINAAGNMVFIISDEEVNFHEFALLYLRLKCENALYLDGMVSRMYAPGLKRNELNDSGHLGPVITVIKE